MLLYFGLEECSPVGRCLAQSQLVPGRVEPYGVVYAALRLRSRQEDAQPARLRLAKARGILGRSVRSGQNGAIGSQQARLYISRRCRQVGGYAGGGTDQVGEAIEVFILRKVEILRRLARRLDLSYQRRRVGVQA